MISSAMVRRQESRGSAYFGKYRGTVVNNVDPQGRGRIQVLVPEVSPVPLLPFALPCAPVGGFQHGMFAVPPPGAGVWIEFEQGDSDYPIWTGCFWGSGSEAPGQAPTANPVLQAITLQTPSQNCVVIDDDPTGGVQIRMPLVNSVIKVTAMGIELNNGLGASILMRGPTIEIDALKITFNKTALEIM